MTPIPTTADVLSHIRRWLSRARPEPSPDADLIHRFCRNGDHSAFAILMDRHGPMVLGVARRVVGDYHLAEDVFQAVFLMLARKAGRLRRPAALPAWLHRTAHNLAVSAVRARQRRQRAESQVIHSDCTSPIADLSCREELAILDEELGRLPEKFRLPLVLCCLEGRSQAEAAALLGWTPGSVKGRLERGRRCLKDRLLRRGLTCVLMTAAPPMLVRPALAASLRQIALSSVRDGASISPLAAALVKEACKPFFISIRKAIFIIALLGFTGTGAAMMALSSRPEQTEEPVAAINDKSAPPRIDLDPEALPAGAVARLGSARLRIGNAAFALTPDGKAIVTVTPQGTVRVFDANTGRLLERRQLTDRDDVNPIGQFRARLSEDGRIAVIHEPGYLPGWKSRVTVWDVASGKRIFRRTSSEKRGLGFGALSPDGKQLAVIEDDYDGTYNRSLRVIDLKSAKIRLIGRTELNVYDVRFSADGKRIVLSQTSALPNGGSSLACFDVAAGKKLWRLPQKGIEFALSPDGKTVVSPGMDQRSYWLIETDPTTGKPTESIVPASTSHPNDQTLIAPDNRTVVMRHVGGEILLWDIRIRKEIRRFALPKSNGSGYGPELGAISPDSRTLITNLGYLQRWDLTTGKPFFAAPPNDTLGGPIEHIGFTPDGKQLFASSWCHSVGLWDVATRQQRSLTRFRRGHRLVRTPKGLLDVFANYSVSPTQVTLSDPITGKPLQTVRWTDPKEVTINGLRVYTLTANGKTLLTIHGEEPAREEPHIFSNYVTACDVASGHRLARFIVKGGNDYYPRSPFSPCGRWVVLGGKLYGVGSGAELFAPAGGADERLVSSDRQAHGPIWFSDDGRLMAGMLRKKSATSAASDTLAVWESATGQLLARYPNSGFVAQVAFAPNGRTFALLDGRGIRLEDLATGKHLAEYAAPDVNCNLVDIGCFTQTLVFAPDGGTLATGHQDGTILLWNVPRPAPIGAAVLAEGETEKLWTNLGDKSPLSGRTAIERLMQHPSEAITFLTDRFHPYSTPDDATIAALLKDLDSDAFAARDAASRKLRAYGALAEPVLRGTLARAPSLEMRRRIEEILSTMKPPKLRLPLTGERLRGVRAIEVLERIGTAAARKLLRSWAEQTADVHLAVEARLALERCAMEKR